MKKAISVLNKYAVTFICSIALLSCASTSIAPIYIAPITENSGADYSIFSESNPDALNSISYGGLSYFLSRLVIDVGFSNRRAAEEDGLLYTGTRIRRGSSELLTLEANRIDFDNVSEDTIRQITEYRTILENLPNERALQTFNRNDQLAYWLNLHNVLLIEQIILRYPLSDMKRFNVETEQGQVNILEAKLVTIQGQHLSLNDIRVNVVYRYWQDTPEVMYGFFLGTLGGPSIIPRAYSANYVSNYLRRNASEFINSTRGTRPFFKTLYVSQFYGAHRDIFFPNWPEDVINHFTNHARSPLSNQLPGVKNIRFTKYLTEVAGVYSGGVADLGGPSAPAVQAVSRDTTGAVNIVGTGEFNPNRDIGPLGGANPADGREALDGQLLGTISGDSQSSVRGDFFRRIETKKRRAAQDFWPEIPRRDSRVTIIDITTSGEQ